MGSGFSRLQPIMPLEEESSASVSSTDQSDNLLKVELNNRSRSILLGNNIQASSTAHFRQRRQSQGAIQDEDRRKKQELFRARLLNNKGKQSLE